MTEFASYQAMRRHIGELYQREEYAQAAEILQAALDAFPDHLLANSYNLALLYARLGEPEKGIQALQYGLDHGVWYGLWDFIGEIWEPFEALKAFAQIKAQCGARRQQAQERAQPELIVVPPQGYTPGKPHPLFIALHGGGETVAAFQPHWTSPKLETEFIVAFVQSSQVVSMTGFSWEEHEVARKEVADAYQAVVQDYGVEAERVIVGGFSSGGCAAIRLALDETFIPVRGFIALCPPKPEPFEAEAVARAAQRGLRGTLLTTEMDPRLDLQEGMAEIFQKEGLPHQFIVTPNIGHWYPTDLDEKIDQAIDHIRHPPQL